MEELRVRAWAGRPLDQRQVGDSDQVLGVEVGPLTAQLPSAGEKLGAQGDRGVGQLLEVRPGRSSGEACGRVLAVRPAARPV